MPASWWPSIVQANRTLIVAFLAHGLSNPEIAKRSYVSVKTVANQVSSILSKLGVRRRRQGRVRFARQCRK